ncbi:MAG: carbohydrate ABC transporter permease [Syntrophothermus sp.]
MAERRKFADQMKFVDRRELANRRKFKEAKHFGSIYLFMLPGLILFFLWTVYPILKVLQMSFYQWNILPGAKSVFLGFSNYIRAFSDPVFWIAVRNTFLYAMFTVPGQMALGMVIALLLDQQIKGRAFFRAAYYLPVITSWVVVSLLFLFLFNADVGLINFILKDLLHVIKDNIAWLQNPATAMAAIMLLGIWKGIGWCMVIFLAALQSIPAELYEAADIDGAGGWQRLWRVTLPLLRPTLVFVSVMLFIGGFNVFISPLLLTGGEPLHQTEVLLLYMYRQAFDFLDFGYGAALSYMLAIFIFIISFIQIRFLRSSVEY